MLKFCKQSMGIRAEKFLVRARSCKKRTFRFSEGREILTRNILPPRLNPQLSGGVFTVMLRWLLLRTCYHRVKMPDFPGFLFDGKAFWRALLSQNKEKQRGPASKNTEKPACEPMRTCSYSHQTWKTARDLRVYFLSRGAENDGGLTPA